MPLYVVHMMIPKELIEKERKAEQRVNTANARYVKAQREFEDAKESLRKIQIEIAAILDGHTGTENPETSTQ